jgi:methionine--tRNA ligase beta chain
MTSRVVRRRKLLHAVLTKQYTEHGLDAVLGKVHGAYTLLGYDNTILKKPELQFERLTAKRTAEASAKEISIPPKKKSASAEAVKIIEDVPQKELQIEQHIEKSHGEVESNREEATQLNKGENVKAEEVCTADASKAQTHVVAKSKGVEKGQKASKEPRIQTKSKSIVQEGAKKEAAETATVIATIAETPKKGKPWPVTKGGKTPKDTHTKGAKGAEESAAKGGGQEEPHAIAKLDLRVGLITKAWKHADSDKLYCETIDVGEDEPREIATGVQQHVDEAYMQNRKVVVLCNLKPAKLGGFKSCGMVLCAQSADKSTVELLEPPADAVVGERITFEGVSGCPATANQMNKKKLLQKVLPDLALGEAMVGQWQGKAFMTSKGPCTASTITTGTIA